MCFKLKMFIFKNFLDFVKFSFLLIIISNNLIAASIDFSYTSVRDKILESERVAATGGSIWLNAREAKANAILMKAKNQEITEGLRNPDIYAPSMHFFHAKSRIRRSEVFRIISKMPKGSFLHGHQRGMVSSKWIIKNIMSQFNVFSCRDQRGIFIFTARNHTKCVTPLENVCTERNNSPDKKQYDRVLEKHINMFTLHPEIGLTERNKLWEKFENIFYATEDIYKYLPVFREYNKRILEELYADNIMYAEIRSSLSPLYCDRNRNYSSLEVLNELEQIVKDFKKTHPDFIGMKIIYAKKNNANKAEMCKRIDTFKELYKAKPNILIGFDIVGQEDLGEPLQKFIDELSELPEGANFFFHAGETNWFGKTDLNMLDAILLNTRRIGHAYALAKHPQLWDTIKSRKIAIEVNPISNQILGYIWDLRNHPAAFYIAEDLPLIISGDDPGIWNGKALSYDFYYAFMSFTSAHADLRVLKQFALNSIRYAILTPEEKRQFNKIFSKKWDKFIDEIINSKY
ncbi:adenosine deaminase 2-like [Condylostylus longicornis]|uniref:adenosine deaminase 2-like n=1 Tax=Condylostylus longicornis TaxID=2530218 RepID=UPI00244DE1BD|nr:adenosine deaminase 2-like [Condylostylus longicornis]